MKLSLILLLLLWIPISIGSPIQPEQFRQSGEISRIRMSPDGKYLAYALREKKTDFVIILDLDTNQQTYAFQMGEDNYVASFLWATNERLLIEKAVVYKGYEHPYLIGHLQAINFDGSKNAQLWGFHRDQNRAKNRELGRFFNIVSVMKEDVEHIMLSTYDKGEGTRRLTKLNIHNGRTSLLERSRTTRASFVVGENGLPVAQLGILPSNDSELIYKNLSGEWIEIKDANDYAIFGSMKSGTILFEKDSGDNSIELIELNRLDGSTKTLVTLNNIEVSSIWKDRNGHLISYTTDDGKPEQHFFDMNSDEAKFYQGINNTFKGTYARVTTQSEDGARKIISVTSDTEPGMYVLFKDGKLSLFDQTFKDIDRKHFSKVLPISFQARDDKTIHGYLTLPTGANSPFPMVVIVHGGPFGVRDYWGFNQTNQLLASRGYAVLRINYRGSGGYGQKFEFSGHKQWGLAMQDDITDGTLWAIENEVADKDHICIYGGSYGGYAALTAVVKEPDLYQCAIGSAGVYDLPMQYKKGDIRRKSAGRSFLEDTLGSEMSVLIENSPIYHVGKIKAALLLAHGTDDIRVPFEHYEKLTEALDRYKIPYEPLVFKDEGHGYFNKKNSLEFNTKMLKFLSEYL